MQENYASGQLQFTDNIKAAVKDAEVVFLCVGTPPRPDGTVDMSYLEGRARKSAMRWPNSKASTW